jgi:G3E family GTPase
VTRIPAWVVTGPLGCGKTTVISRLLANKPPEERWVVLLNEYSDAGIDALTVAAHARGAFDVRLVPGGCLCCVGEMDFRRNLQELVDTVRPERIIVEPSGLGHPAGVIEELLGHEASGALRLEAVVGLLDPLRLEEAIADPGSLPRAIADIADSLVLSKADLASAEQAARFGQFASARFPPKRWAGSIQSGDLPAEALGQTTGGPPPRLTATAARGPADGSSHGHERAHGQDHGASSDEPAVVPGGRRRTFRQLGHVGASWTLPRAAGFSEDALLAALRRAAADPAVRRLKLVARVADDDWTLAQVAAGRVEQAPCSWRRDSRIELVLDAGDGPADWARWDAIWSGCLQAEPGR